MLDYNLLLLNIAQWLYYKWFETEIVRVINAIGRLVK